MSLRELVDDARFLQENGRHLGAFAILMIAVAASSRRAFPKGTRSRANPNKEMTDGEAFRLFIGGRIRKMLFGDFGGPDEGHSGLEVDFRGKPLDVAYMLYKFYRCELVHEGELPEDVEFVPSHPNPGITLANRGVSVSISAGNKLVLDHGWIDLFIEAVVNARCNGIEFGIRHYELVFEQGTDETAFHMSLAARYETSLGRILIMKDVVRMLTPQTIAEESDSLISERFAKLVASGDIIGGAISGLATHEFTGWSGELQQKGLNLLREVAGAYKLIEV